MAFYPKISWLIQLFIVTSSSVISSSVTNLSSVITMGPKLIWSCFWIFMPLRFHNKCFPMFSKCYRLYILWNRRGEKKLHDFKKTLTPKCEFQLQFHGSKRGKQCSPSIQPLPRKLSIVLIIILLTESNDQFRNQEFWIFT